MSASLTGTQAYDLCMKLLAAESEEEVVDILTEAGFWGDPNAWRWYGDKENNFATIGNQQSSPVAAMVEKFVNAIDAVLMLQCQLEGIDPEGPDAPQSIAEALERYFSIRNGNLVNITAEKRAQLARRIGFVATGTKQRPNYLVFDLGEGQTPGAMPRTFLSLGGSNKLRIPFVQGKFDMGSTGVLQFCGRHNLQLLISRRHPDLAAIEADPLGVYWGFTIVRRQDPSEGRRSSVFTYLAPNREVPRFQGGKIQIPDNGRGREPLPDLEWGTIIKMYEYEMTNFKRHIRLDFHDRAALLLPRIGLPIRFYERRDYEDDHTETTLVGLHVRLEEDKGNSIEPSFPSFVDFRVQREQMKAAIYAFRKGHAESYRRHKEGIIFTINGQTHGILPQSFFTRNAVGMSYLADSILVIVDCDGISGRAREDLFMNSRDRLRAGELHDAIERRLEEILSDHPALRELRERRRREDVEGRLADAAPLVDLLNDVLLRSPVLRKLFVEGTELSNPYKPQSARGKTDADFTGKRYPTYFTLRKGEENKVCHINQRFRTQFETDAENKYFGRDIYPGRYEFHIDGEPIEDGVFNLLNGVATLTVTLPAGVQVGDTLHCEMWVTDDTRAEPFYNEFWRYVEGAVEVSGGSKGRRLPPAEFGEGDRLLPSGLSIPDIIEVRREDWPRHQFDKYSALKVIGRGGSCYDFYVNMDNHYLQSEIKSLPKEVDPRLTEARFKYALVLIGLAVLRDQADSADQQQEGETAEEYVSRIAKSVSSVLLPMISSLGALDIPGEVE